MSRTLTAYVHVVDEDNQPVVLKPGDELPKWAEKQVTNEKAFAVDDEEDADTASDSAPAKRAPRKAAAKRAPRKATSRPDPVQSEDAAASGGSGDAAGVDADESGGSQQ